MVGRASDALYPVALPSSVCRPVKERTLVATSNKPATFAFGALAGILGGFVLGIFFGKYVLQGMTMIYRLFIADDAAERRERMKFELMLQ